MELDKYTVGQARSIDELAQGVNQMIAKGWTAVGGVTVAQVLGLEGRKRYTCRLWVNQRPR